MKVKPSKKIVVIEPAKLEDISVTGGGIVAVSEKTPELGKVVEIGIPDKKEGMPLDIKKGDIIAYRRYGETKFFVGGKELLFV
jgi:co-chaperonin GroES (HSP10)